MDDVLINVENQNHWSAERLGWTASIASCAVCAILSAIVMHSFVSYPSTVPVGLQNLNIFFVGMTAFLQLIASTLHHSPVRREGDTIKGMIFSDLGDDPVCMTVAQWTRFWLVSVFCWSAVTSSVVGFVVYLLTLDLAN